MAPPLPIFRGSVLKFVRLDVEIRKYRALARRWDGNRQGIFSLLFSSKQSIFCNQGEPSKEETGPLGRVIDGGPRGH